MRDPARRVKALLVLVVCVVGAAGLALTVIPSSADNGHDFHGAAIPALFSDARIAGVDAPLQAAETRGHELARQWLDQHPVTTDAEFAKWAVGAVGGPPSAAETKRELAELQAIAAQRDPAGTRAAVWLESHGKKQPWKALRDQTETFVAQDREDQAKTTLKAAFDLAGTIEDAAKARYHRQPPYVADPRLNAGGVRVDSGVHVSYPSSHMVDAGVGLAVLDALDPHLRSEYDWMADEIAFSRLYSGGHYPSDLRAGMVLGTLVGDYELRRGGLGTSPPRSA